MVAPPTAEETQTTGTVRLLLVDDDPLVLSTLRLYFSTPAAEGIEIIGEATDGSAALDLLASDPVDVLMTDVNMPEMDGITLLGHVRALENPPVFIAMTALDEDETMLSILSEGGAGYILKSSSPEFIIDSVRQALAGGTVVSPQPATRLVQHLPSSRPGQDAEGRISRLTDNEERVLGHICAGRSNSEIAQLTGRSASAVKKTVSSLLSKFGTDSRIQLAVLAVEAGFHPTAE